MENALSNWRSLNDFLRDASEEQCKQLLNKERGGKQRVQFMLRIHGRFNVLRAERERTELLGPKKESARAASNRS